MSRVLSVTFHRGAHLDLSETYDASARCPICLEPGPRRPLFAIQQAPLIRLVECARCGGASAERMPLPEVLDRYYRSYYDATGEQKMTTSDVGRIARHVLRYIPGESLAGNRPVRILDFGGGDGSLCVELARILARPCEAIVVDFWEPPKHGLDFLDLRRAETLADIAPGAAFDLVVASAIVEHIPEAQPVFANLFARIAPGGYFYARTPYAAPLCRWLPVLDFTYPGHVHDLGPAFWNGVLETFRLDARIVSSRPSVVETAFSEAPLRSAVASMLKLPSLLEVRLRGHSRRMLWSIVGGWEIVLRRRSPAL